MIGCNLTEVELMYLTEFSYVDIPTHVYGNSMTLDNLITVMLMEDLSKKNRKKLQDIRNYLDENKDSSLGKIKLSKYQNNNPIKNSRYHSTSDSGFVGYAFKDSDDNGIVVYRGSEGCKLNKDGILELAEVQNMWADWGSNALAAVGIMTTQQKEALEFYDEFIKDVSGNKVVAGHSKGGNLAETVMVNRFDDDVYGRTFNGAPYTATNEEYKKKAEEVLTHPNYLAIRVEGDVVSYLGDSVNYRNTKTVKYNGGFYINPLAPHSVKNAKIKNGKFVESGFNFYNIASNGIKLPTFKKSPRNIKLVTMKGDYCLNLSKKRINTISTHSHKNSDYGELIVDLDELRYQSKRLSSIKSQADNLCSRLNSIIQRNNLVELKTQYNSVIQTNSKLNKSVNYIKDTIELINEADKAVYNLSKKL